MIGINKLCKVSSVLDLLFLRGFFLGNACPCRVRECKGRKEKGHKLNPEAKKQMFLLYLYPLHLTHELSVGLQ